jgi:hypothetical protein
MALEQVSAMTPPGCFVEVGVFQGGSASVLYRVCQEQGRRLYLYDTFTGIPFKDPIDSHNVGDFAQNSNAPEELSKVLPKAFITVGVFPRSAVAMEPVAFAHLDCDQYKSYTDSINHLLPMMVSGGIMYFDDYDCVPGATQAVNELIGKDKLEWAGQYVGEHFVGKAFYRIPDAG